MTSPRNPQPARPLTVKGKSPESGDFVTVIDPKMLARIDRLTRLLPALGAPTVSDMSADQVAALQAATQHVAEACGILAGLLLAAAPKPTDPGSARVLPFQRPSETRPAS